MVTLKNAFQAAKRSILLVVIFGLLFLLLTAFLPDFAIVAALSIPINFFLYLYAGYTATRKMKQSVMTGGAAGALASLVSGILLLLLQIIFLFAGLTPVTDMLGVENTSILEVGLTTATLGIVVAGGITALVFSIAVNFIVGLMGGYMGQKM